MTKLTVGTSTKLLTVEFKNFDFFSLRFLCFLDSQTDKKKNLTKTKNKWISKSTRSINRQIQAGNSKSMKMESKSNSTERQEEKTNHEPDRGNEIGKAIRYHSTINQSLISKNNNSTIRKCVCVFSCY